MILMRNTKCRFCSKIFNNKQKYCNPLWNDDRDQIVEDWKRREIIKNARMAGQPHEKI